MTQRVWTAVDKYITDILVPSDEVLDQVLAANEAAGLPPHDVSPNQGKFLHLLSLLSQAKQILEIGTLGGYSTIWFARSLPADGVIVTLEADPIHARAAAVNIERAGLAALVDLRVGLALESLDRLHSEGAKPFDLIFIDADKPNNPAYLQWALALSRPGTLIVGDNVIRDGAILDAATDDPRVRGIQDFFQAMKAEPRLDATALQTVGSKGYDGFSLAIVTG